MNKGNYYVQLWTGVIEYFDDYNEAVMFAEAYETEVREVR